MLKQKFPKAFHLSMTAEILIQKRKKFTIRRDEFGARNHVTILLIFSFYLILFLLHFFVNILF